MVISSDKNSFKNYTSGATHTSTVKHAIADLADNSNDYSEDMDESVAFSKGCSDKENIELHKKLVSKPSKYISSKRNRKGLKTNRSEYVNMNPLNFSSNLTKPKEFVKNAEKRRASYMS
jgi:hypothetical protein